MHSKFFQQINYSSSTEDSDAELLALKLASYETVVCVTGSGARTLDLIPCRPEKIFSVDFNAAQNHLLRLKLAAYSKLNYPEFCAFLGLNDQFTRSQKLEIYHSLAGELSSDCRQYWNNSKSQISKGILYCGTWEKLLRAMSKTTVLRTRHVNGLLNSKTVQEQSDYWEKHWSGWFFKTYLKVLSNRFLWTSIIREPGAKLIPVDFDVANYLYECLRKMARHSLMSENPYANLLFCGRYTSRCKLPPHLREQNYSVIKDGLERVKVVDEDLAGFLARSENRFDAFSLSDFSSYASEKEYNETWQAVINAARKDAKFCERQFLVKRHLALQALRRDQQLEEQLKKVDHTCLYTFCAGRVASA